MNFQICNEVLSRVRPIRALTTTPETSEAAQFVALQNRARSAATARRCPAPFLSLICILQQGLAILHSFIRGGSGVLGPGEPQVEFVPWHPAMLKQPQGLIGLFVRALEVAVPDLTTPLRSDTISLAT
jgi:hypothetical protein